MKEQSQQFLRRRKLLLVLPILIVPFVTMAFWALGGGKGKTPGAVAAKEGLNMRLPDAKLKPDRGWNKMSFYEMAQKDSEKIKEAFAKEMHGLKAWGDSGNNSPGQIKMLADRYAGAYHQDGLETGGSGSKAAEQNLLQKISKLEAAINKPSPAGRGYTTGEAPRNNYAHRAENNPDMDRLEHMLHVMKSPDGDNTEIKQLDTVLEKILDLQYPERVQQKQQAQRREQAVPNSVVQKKTEGNGIAVMGEAQSTVSSGFYTAGGQQVDVAAPHAVEAEIAETQTIVAGAVIKLRLLNDITVSGNLVPKNTPIYGIGKLSGERLAVDISSITSNTQLYTVGMEVYDLDGLPGVYIPGAIGRTVAKQSVNTSIQSAGLSTLDGSLEAQAATAGINAAKELIGRKVRLTRVTLKAGYKVLLKIKQ